VGDLKRLVGELLCGWTRSRALGVGQRGVRVNVADDAGRIAMRSARLASMKTLDLVVFAGGHRGSDGSVSAAMRSARAFGS